MHFKATSEDYKLLENMNKLTSLKYLEMKDIAINISRNLKDLNQKCEYTALHPSSKCCCAQSSLSAREYLLPGARVPENTTDKVVFLHSEDECASVGCLFLSLNLAFSQYILRRRVDR